jgi:hypothetical protein
VLWRPTVGHPHQRCNAKEASHRSSRSPLHPTHHRPETLGTLPAGRRSRRRKPFPRDGEGGARRWRRCTSRAIGRHPNVPPDGRSLVDDHDALPVGIVKNTSARTTLCRFLAPRLAPPSSAPAAAPRRDTLFGSATGRLSASEVPLEPGEDSRHRYKCAAIPGAACQPGSAPVRTSSSATSRSFVLVRCEAWVRMVNASSSLILCRSIRIPLACSIHARDIIAVRR